MGNEIRTMKPKVSVIMITFGHEKYIKDAIMGVFLQKTDFLIELIIANDKSPDNSDKIILDTIKKCPSNVSVKYIHNEFNMGVNPNYVNAYLKSKGDYIASCEGDDYWTDPLKLQKQVEFLEQNNEYAICFHKVDILHADGSVVPDYITKIPKNYQERTTLANSSNYIHTPSVVFRNVIQDDINSVEFQKSPIGDYFLYLLVSKYGKIGFINDTMAVYRHGVGVYSSLASLKKHSQELLLFVNLYSAEKDIVIKEAFYNNILDYVKHLEKLVEKNEHSSSILKTRRHIFIEKLYRLFK